MNNTPQETEDPVTTYLKDNSRKKSYAEATLDAVMHETGAWRRSNWSGSWNREGKMRCSPPRPILSDGDPRAIMEPPVTREYQRRERELCDNSNAPTSCDSIKSDDPYPQSATSPWATLSNSTSEENQGACPSLVHNPSLSSTTNQTKEYPGELRQCDVTGASARSHFSLFGHKRNKHRTKRGGTKAIHHHVLQSKPTIHRVATY